MSLPFLQSKRERLLMVMAGIFIASAITAELISSKVFLIHLQIGSLDFGSFPGVVGILPWPIVFLATDVINEFYGRAVVRRLSILTCCLIAWAFVLVYAAMNIPTILSSPTDKEFAAVFGQSQWIIAGSIVAFMVSQLLDSFVFWFVRKRTGERMIWLRSTGSTLVSQLIDSFIVLYIGFVLPKKFPADQSFFAAGMTNYVIKLLIAVALTPLIYLFHYMIDKYFGEKEAHEVIKESAEESLHQKLDE